jgi:hypothetical protein
MSPGSFEGAVMRVTPHDQEDVEVMKSEETYQGYVDNSENYGNVPFKDKLNPSSSWAIPFVTGHEYRIHWETGMDFTEMKVEVS